jgi:hypothetical protein
MSIEKKELEKVKSNHRIGWAGILEIYPIRELCSHWTNIISLVFSTISSSLSVLLGDGSKAVSALADSVITIIPGILGVVLAAYALIITFFSGSLLDKATKPIPGKEHSLFQRSNASFALAVIVLSVILLSGFGVQQLSRVAEKIPVPPIVANTVNLLVSFILNWGLVYGIALCWLAALNMFGIGQTSSLIKALERIKAAEPDDKPTDQSAS